MLESKEEQDKYIWEALRHTLAAQPDIWCKLNFRREKNNSAKLTFLFLLTGDLEHLADNRD